MAPKRTFTSRERNTKLRDARLIIIATEGILTEPKYFRAFVSPKYYGSKKVHIELLEVGESPIHVVNKLDGFKSEYKLRKGFDELWVVIDIDKWKERNLSEVAQLCYQKGYDLAISNPCFELWLILHLEDLTSHSQEKLEILETNLKDRVGGRNVLERELADILGHYNKTNPDCDRFLPHVSRAIEHLCKLDKKPSDRWPQSLGTRVYKLAENIIKYSGKKPIGFFPAPEVIAE